MPAMLFAGMPYRGHGPGRPRRSYKAPSDHQDISPDCIRATRLTWGRPRGCSLSRSNPPGATMTACNHSRWEPSHDYRPLETRSERQAWRVAALTGATMLVEIAAGYAFNSMALLADGWHMASHMLAIGLTALAYLLGRRYAVSLLLRVVGARLALECWGRLWQPQVIAFEVALGGRWSVCWSTCCRPG